MWATTTQHTRETKPMGKSEEIQQAVEAYLLALTAKEKAEQAHETARELLVGVFATHGIDEFTHEEIKVAVSPSERRSFALDKLRKAVSPALFRKVTKPSVDTKAWDSAVEKGEIPSRVIKSVVEITNYVRVLVKPAKGAVKPASKASEVA